MYFYARCDFSSLINKKLFIWYLSTATRMRIELDKKYLSILLIFGKHNIVTIYASKIAT